jgi:hypothetical protein
VDTSVLGEHVASIFRVTLKVVKWKEWQGEMRYSPVLANRNSKMELGETAGM